MQDFDVFTHTLVADVGLGATFTVAYPTGRTADDYLGAKSCFITSHSIMTLFQEVGDFSIVFGSANISITLATGLALPNGAKLGINLRRAEAGKDMADPATMTKLDLVRIILGVAATAVANGAVLSQNCSATTGLATGINGSLASAGIATFDVPRNVVAAWTGTAVLTVTGKDKYGVTMRESSASGTTFTGKKAFKTITGISVSADVTGLTVGSGVVLGLPVFVADVADLVKEAVDGAAPTAGTFVAGVQTTASATTGDIRGTYNPNSAPNGARNYELSVMVRRSDYKGVAQF